MTENQILIKIKFYAQSKDFFGDEISFETHATTISDLKLALEYKNPDAKEMLLRSRFAIENQFVGDEIKLKNGILIELIPPSSGG